jgi:hypothetical protein
MSELDSLYLRVHLTKHAYEKYMASQAADARDFSDSMPWLSKARMHGPGFVPERINEIGRASRKLSVSEEISHWANGFAGSSLYDESTETWRFCIFQLAENYEDFLDFLPTVRAVCWFKDRPGIDFILLYPYFWGYGDYYTALIELMEGASAITGSTHMGVLLSRQFLDEANAFIESVAPTDQDSGTKNGGPPVVL